MHFATLASGSSGNAIVVGEGDRCFLVDCGITVRRLLANLTMIDIPSGQLEGIIITHEHIDHIKGVGALARKLKIPVYATKGIWNEMEPKIGLLSPDQKRIIKKQVSLAGMNINLISTSHDSMESYGLKVRSKRYALGIATDSGIVTEDMHRNLQGCDAYIVEANHDVDRLWQGRYPYFLKKRITGSRGHMSNFQLADALSEWLAENARKVVLAHLSEENNTPELALTSVIKVLKDSRVRKRCSDLRIRVAPRNLPHELIVLDE